MADIDRPTALLSLAREIASRNPEFQVVLGPGAGNHATNQFVAELQRQVRELFNDDFCEKKLCGETALAVDFYFPEEATVVEVAFGLPNPGTEFEKDVLKALMAQDLGHTVRRLVFISRPGAVKKCSQPGRSAVIRWAREKHGLMIKVEELAGEPRRRHRSRAKRVT